MMKVANSIESRHYFPRSVTPSCRDCPVLESCLAAMLPTSHEGDINHALCFRKKLAVGYALYRSGDPLTAIYVIQAGSFKSQLPGENGRDYITGIHLPGEIIGIEGIASGQHTRNVIALEESVVCSIPVRVLDRLSTEIPRIQRWFHRMLSREISAVARAMTLLGCRKAEERVAAFLLDLSERFARLGHSPRDFDLRLTRLEIGCHLGLSRATVSRAFARFGREGVVSTCKRRVHLLDLYALKQWVSGRRDNASSRRIIYGQFGCGQNPQQQARVENDPHTGKYRESQPVPSKNAWQWFKPRKPSIRRA